MDVHATVRGARAETSSWSQRPRPLERPTPRGGHWRRRRRRSNVRQEETPPGTPTRTTRTSYSSCLIHSVAPSADTRKSRISSASNHTAASAKLPPPAWRINIPRTGRKSYAGHNCPFLVRVRSNTSNEAMAEVT